MSSESIAGSHDELPADPNAVLFQLAYGFRITQMLHVAATLDIAERLAEYPQTAGELAQATETHAPSLYRLLRALASVGVFAEDAQGRFALTPVGAGLRRSAPGSVYADVLFYGSSVQWALWGDLLYSVRTGQTAFDHHFGMTVWEHRSRHPDDNAIANRYFSALSRRQADAVVAAGDFGGIGTLMDAGGGQGVMLAAILRANPGLKGILFDQPQVVAGASAVLEQAGVADRCRVVGGSFFEPLPAGADAIALKNVLHDWADEQAMAILRNCRRALPSNGRLLVVDGVIPPGNAPHDRKLLDLQMLIGAGGRERTEREWRSLFDAGGFGVSRIIPTASDEGLSIIECRPVA